MLFLAGFCIRVKNLSQELAADFPPEITAWNWVDAQTLVARDPEATGGRPGQNGISWEQRCWDWGPKRLAQSPWAGTLKVLAPWAKEMRGGAVTGPPKEGIWQGDHRERSSRWPPRRGFGTSGRDWGAGVVSSSTGLFRRSAGLATLPNTARTSGCASQSLSICETAAGTILPPYHCLGTMWGNKAWALTCCLD